MHVSISRSYIHIHTYKYTQSYIHIYPTELFIMCKFLYPFFLVEFSNSLILNRYTHTKFVYFLFILFFIIINNHTLIYAITIARFLNLFPCLILLITSECLQMNLIVVSFKFRFYFTYKLVVISYLINRLKSQLFSI